MFQELQALIGQGPFESPSVFNFYRSDSLRAALWPPLGLCFLCGAGYMAREMYDRSCTYIHIHTSMCVYGVYIYIICIYTPT